jgi:DNA-directed RNA polymerase I subunit RPA49
VSSFTTVALATPNWYTPRYLIGIRDKTTNKMTLRTAPLFLVSHHVKALQSSGATASSDRPDYTLAKNQLGEAFGTKKARARIRAAERNKVDVGAMGGGVQDVLQGMIQSNTSTLPQKQEAEQDANDNRPIPRHNDQASSPAEVSDCYPLLCHSHSMPRYTHSSTSFRTGS